MVQFHVVLWNNVLIQSIFGLEYVRFSLLVSFKKRLYIIFLWMKFVAYQGSLRIYDKSEVISVSSSLWDTV